MSFKAIFKKVQIFSKQFSRPAEMLHVELDVYIHVWCQGVYPTISWVVGAFIFNMSMIFHLCSNRIDCV